MDGFVEYSIQLFRGRDRQLVDAQLCSLAEKHLEDFEQRWKPVLLGSAEEDQYWDWERKHRIYGDRVGAEAYVVEFEQTTQGLMLLETLGHRSQVEPNRRIVYVHSLATAPWNRPSIQDPPEYRLVGSTLLEFARYRSIELAYGGLVGLHALPGAEEFYRRLDMLEDGADPDKENLVYFEWYQRQSSENNALANGINWETNELDTLDWENGETDDDL